MVFGGEFGGIYKEVEIIERIEMMWEEIDDIADQIKKARKGKEVKSYRWSKQPRKDWDEDDCRDIDDGFITCNEKQLEDFSKQGGFPDGEW